MKVRFDSFNHRIFISSLGKIGLDLYRFGLDAWNVNESECLYRVTLKNIKISPNR